MLVVCLWGLPALALQPLEAFVHSAMLDNVDVREAQTNLRQQNAQKNIALGHVLPQVNAKGSYTRNQYQVQFPFDPGDGVAPILLTIQPGNQWDGTLTVKVPLVDLSNFAQLSAAAESRKAVANQGAQMQLSVSSQVAQRYYQLVADMALVDASQKALDVAQASLHLTQDLMSAGRSAALDVNRAKAEVERQVQQLTAAKLQVQVDGRALASLCRQEPELSQTVQLQDDLRPEPPLSDFMAEDMRLPGLAASIGMRRVRERQAIASRFSFVPALSAQFNERFTNVTGFSGGHTRYFTAVATLNWDFDWTAFANVANADATAQLARIDEMRTRLRVHDSIFVGWQTVDSNIARSRSAREQEKVSAEAAVLAKDRYAAGAATQLDLLQAQRDAFSAEASRIQADADLLNARIQLRLYAGQMPFTEAKEPS
jgi:outer membrane protein TolC